MRSLATTRADVDTLFERWQHGGDHDARDELVDRFLPLARNLARRYVGSHEPIEDLTQVANLALLKAIDRFDRGRGAAFATFAVPTILGELKRHFRDRGWSVRVPRTAQERALKVETAQRRLTARTGRVPTVKELAEFMELSVDDVLDALETASAHFSESLDAPREDSDGDPSTLGDMLGEADQRFEFVEDRATIACAMDGLSARERYVLALRFEQDLTQSEIGERLGISQMQVSRILRRSLSQLRNLSSDAAAAVVQDPGENVSRDLDA